MPCSWEAHGQARIIVNGKEDISIKLRKLGVSYNDLPTMSFDVGFGREKKTIVNFFYREFMSGVSGLHDNHSQAERLTKQIQI